MKQLMLRLVRSTSIAGLLLVPLLLTGCPRGDVGAPCNHGRLEPPRTKLVTFPALACNDLLCIYADEEEAPSGNCTDDGDCNTDDRYRFECNIREDQSSGTCRLRPSYVLDRSMCSKRCTSNSDCQDGGVTERNLADETQCRTGFSCARIQGLGKFCCEKLCVCNDDLNLAASGEFDLRCEAGTLEGCCDQDPRPDACG
jgi:hypothetical protein